MSKAPRRKVFVDLSTLAADGSNGGARGFVLRLLGALLHDAAFDLDLLVKPAAAPAVSDLVNRGATLHRLGHGLDVEEPRLLRRLFRRSPISRFLPDPAGLRRRRANVLFSPLGTAAFHETPLPHVAIAYDFQELRYPDFFDAKELRRRRAFRADLARADRVVAISQATGADAIALGGVAPDRVSVIPPLAGEIRTPLAAGDVEERLRGAGIPREGYALYPANFWPHKNHERLLAAAAIVLRSEPEFRLVLCGAIYAERTRLESVVSARGLSGSVRVLPYQPDEDITALLQGARCLVFPSLFEGFGLPVLEALHLGTAVTCADLPALREVAGDAALYFDPADIASIADALEILWRSGKTRSRLVEEGQARAELFARLDTASAWKRALTFP